MEVMKKNELLAIEANHNMELKKVKRKQYYLAKKNEEILEKIDNGDILSMMNRALKGMSKKKHADVLLDMVMDGSMLGPKGQQAGKFFSQRSDKSISCLEALASKRYSPSRLSEPARN